jgi:hypothetical protein
MIIREQKPMRGRLTFVRMGATHFLLFDEIHRGRVHTVAQAGRLRTIFENMANMRAAAVAHHFGPMHAVAAVDGGLDLLFLERGIKARPTASGVILGLGAEKLVPAADAQIHALVVEVPVAAGKSVLGAFLPGNRELLGGKKFAPFFVGFFDFLAHHAPT